MASENHIENPFEYFIEKLTWGVSDIGGRLLPNPARHAGQAVPQVRKIAAADLWDALRKGTQDLGALRDDILFIGIVYPVAGLLMARLAFSYDLLPMLFPLASGFAIIGPVAAVGLYEMSRRRELGEHVNWLDAFGVLRSPALGSIIGMGAILLALFGLWLGAAYEINLAVMGPGAPPTLRAFSHNLFWTQAGATLIVAGIGVGFLFAVAAFAIGVVTVPLLLDRDVGLWTAIKTSLKVVAANPGTMALWGLTVAGLLVLGSIPALVGLIFVVPVLGHASWHLYRKVVA
ncbi:MAG TPA: DUF2189 domain-containing protein [Phenylobacterium sp.]|jgi:uncharacterized membrane protein|uniref:DUF2189 domain-containing protein n=1 Tax=Phenylobacterium sp. TaxID=1871053 RepID=UPI002B6F8530|nr:DUF2189 domain-containing protein [Phenylobacterium sp.]HXA38934.1 DUF2189 domain-containing protein [Phenylobacterium sp.]